MQAMVYGCATLSNTADMSGDIILLTPRHAPAPVAAVKALQQGRPGQLGAARAGEPHRLPDLVVELHLDTTCQTSRNKDTDL